jgi:hypothetical protein
MKLTVEVKKIPSIHQDCGICPFEYTNLCEKCESSGEFGYIYEIISVEPLNKVVEDGQAKECLTKNCFTRLQVCKLSVNCKDLTPAPY